MSVFAAAAMALPPRYSSTRTQPPPYKGDSGFQSSSSASSAPSIPPPVYRPTSNNITPSRSSSPAPSLSTIATAEPPQYASIISAPRPKPQPSATRQPRPSTPTWKDPYVETDAADSMYELQQRSSRQRAQEEDETEDWGKNWCWGCFWWYFHVPSDAQGVHWSAYGPYVYF